MSIENKNISAFTIIELLIVIVIIGILAAITIVSYTGITTRANNASLQSDLANASKKLSMYYAEYGTYPTNINLSTGCPTAPNINDSYCIKFRPDTTPTYASTSPSTYVLTYSNNTLTYKVTPTQTPTASVGGANWIVIGNQLWAKTNLNVGTRIAGTVNQTNNSGTNIIEKYCYNDLESNCATYGGLYQWDEVMNYSTTEGTQGICPANSHIPTDNDWKVLEMQLGMSQATANLTGWRGTDEGAKLKVGGVSEMDVALAGYRNDSGSFVNLSSYVFLWSSSESGGNAWRRGLGTSFVMVDRVMNTKSHSFSLRCLGN